MNNPSNNNYEQNFIQNVKQAALSDPRLAQPSSNSNATKLPMVITTVLVFVTLIESIALAMALINIHNMTSAETVINDDSISSLNDGPYQFDDDGIITAFDLTCTAEDGSAYTFDKSHSYQKIDDSTVLSSGTYSILKGTAVLLNNPKDTASQQVVYYDGIYIVEGVTFYECENNTGD